MCAYQGVKNVSFSENFAYVLNGWCHFQLNNKQEAIVYSQNNRKYVADEQNQDYSLEGIFLFKCF